MNKVKKIVLLGGGYGGVLTAKKLARKFKKNDEIEITLIDKNSYHTMLTELHEVAAGRVPENAIRIEFEKIFAGRKVNLVMDNILEVDYNSRILKGSNDNYEYDYLVIGTGSKPTYFGCKGAEENSFPLWSFNDAVRIKEHILDMFRKATVEKNPELRSRMLSFVVVGCGFTGIEMIGELGEWKKRLCKDFNISEDDVKLHVVDQVARVLPMFKDKSIAKTEKRLKKLGIEVITSSPITEVNHDHVCLNNVGCIESMTVIWAAGVESSDFLEKTNISKKARNRVVTNDKLQSVDHENVFAVGDNIFYIPEGEDRPVPQMVENAEHSASLVAHNIRAHISNSEMKSYKPSFHGAMVSIGGGYGVAEVGLPNKMDLSFSGFLAMLTKHLINVIYFLQVAGFNKIWTYMMDEIFHVPDRRSFLGGHFSKASPNFWIVPLRMFIGFSWLLEGLDKLPKILDDPTNIFLIPASLAATSGATEAVGEAVTYAEPLGVPAFIESIVGWSMEAFFYAPDGSFTFLAQIFQTLMVAGEIVVGLCLLGGLFTALMSIVSILMGMMIWSSGMAPPEMLWYMSGSVATIGGSGSVFGMDYYVLPFLKKRWKKIKLVKKWYLYTD